MSSNILSTQKDFGRTFIRKAWLPIGLIAIWWVLSGIYNSSYFPPLQDILVSTWEIWIVAGGVLTDLWPSFLRILLGFSIALVAGIALGTLFGLMPAVERVFRPLTEAFRAIPGAAMLPIALTFWALVKQ